jgi:hypothetical protein
MNIEEQSVEEQKSEKAELSHWLTYYQVLIDDIKFAKSQQWRLPV